MLIMGSGSGLGEDVGGVLSGLGVTGTLSGLWIRCGLERLDGEQKSGWKVHVSGGPGNFLAIMDLVVPVLEEEACAYKVIGSLEALEELNEGRYGLMQVGKLVTVYFRDEAEGARVAGLLAGVLKGFTGPVPVSDFVFEAGVPVSYRFGPFDGRYGVDLMGQKKRLLRHPALGDVVDVTDGGGVVPPLCNHFPRQDMPDHAGFLRERYLLVRVLQISAKGATFVGVALKGAGRVPLLIKTARVGAHLDKHGRDGVWALRREHGLLSELSALDCVPEAGHLEESETGDLALVRPFVEGDTFWELWSAADGRSVAGQSRLNDVLDKAMLALEQLHDRGIIVRDLSPGNILVREDSGICFLDLELAHRVGEETPPYRRGTLGFYDEKRGRWAEPMLEDDLFALSQLRRMGGEGVPIAALSVATPADVVQEEEPDDVYLQHCFEAYLRAWFSVDWELSPADPDRFNVYSGLSGLILQGLEWSEDGLLDCIPYTSLDRVLVGLDDSARQVYQIPGLYFGASGMAVALVGLGRALGDDMVEHRGRILLGQLSRAAHPSPDICQGTGGFLAACVTAHGLTGDDCYRYWGLHAAHDLLHRAEVHPDGWLWFWREGPYGSLSGMRGYGFGHGVSGIVHTMLRAFEMSGDEALRSGSMRGLAMLAHSARHCGDGAGLWWPPDERDDTVWNGWCHGTPGVVKVLARAYRVLGRKEDEVLLEQAMDGVLMGNNSELCLCHGVASRLDAYLDGQAAMGMAFPERFRVAMAEDAGLLMEVVRAQGWGNELDAVQGAGAGSGLMTGFGGLLRVLLRYHGCLGHGAGEVLP